MLVVRHVVQVLGTHSNITNIILKDQRIKSFLFELDLLDAN